MGRRSSTAICTRNQLALDIKPGSTVVWSLPGLLQPPAVSGTGTLVREAP